MGIEQFIDNEVKGNDVVLFMKGTPQFPMCGFSGQVVQILDHLGVAYKGINVLESDEIRNGIKSYSNWPTIPQLYVKGEFVGGCDIVREMFQAGELAADFERQRRFSAPDCLTRAAARGDIPACYCDGRRRRACGAADWRVWFSVRRRSGKHARRRLGGGGFLRRRDRLSGGADRGICSEQERQSWSGFGGGLAALGRSAVSACYPSALLSHRHEPVGAILAVDHSHARVGQVESDQFRAISWRAGPSSLRRVAIA